MLLLFVRRNKTARKKCKSILKNDILFLYATARPTLTEGCCLHLIVAKTGEPMEFRDLKAQYAHVKPQMDTALQEVLEASTFIAGGPVATLEKELAAYAGCQHCLSCGNGTDALELLLLAYGIGPGDAVFVPDFTFFATAEAVSTVGGTPIFVDVEADSFNLCPAALEQAILAVQAAGALRPKAVLAVDLFGRPANYPALEATANQHGLLLFEDAAQGFSGAIHGQRTGSFGAAATTSFFPAKPLGCYGDGGAIFTNDSEKDTLLRSLAVHGKGSDKYINVRIGRNSRLDTLQAAVLRVKLGILEEEREKIRQAAAAYTSRLGAAVCTPLPDGEVQSAWAQYTLRLRSAAQRDALAAALKAKNIPTMVYYPLPLHQQAAFASIAPKQVDACPTTVALCQTVLSLPMHPYLSTQQIDTVCDAVLACL